MKSQRWRQRLLRSTRGQILALLRSENRTVNELAAALNLTDNAIRAHLVSLERDGLVQQHGTRAGTRKPHAAYGLSSEAEHIFPKAYGPLLNHFVTVISNRLTPRTLRATMHEVGAAVAADHLERLKGCSRRCPQKARSCCRAATSCSSSSMRRCCPGRSFPPRFTSSCFCSLRKSSTVETGARLPQ